MKKYRYRLSIDVWVVAADDNHANFKIKEFLQKVRRGVWAVEELREDEIEFVEVKNLDFGEIVER